MKVCLHNRNTIEYLKKADEIKVAYVDHAIILDYFEDYPTADIILELANDDSEIDWAALKNYNILSQGRFICCVSNLLQMEACKQLNIKFYYGYPVSSFYELNSLKDLGVCYIRLAPPLSHQLDEVARFGIPVRAIPNVCYQDYLPHKNGIHGQWIRPEDLSLYEVYIDAIEFEDCNVEKEQALYRIYMEEKEWPGEFNELYTNFDYKGVNRMLEAQDAIRRMTCGQTCEMNGNCHLCDTVVNLADPEKWEYIKKN
jgi:hypothetical protein